MAAPSGGTQDAADDGVELRKCSQCGVMQTHMWREGPDGRRSLCNSCGLKFRKTQEQPLFVMEGPRKRQPSSRLIEEVAATAAAATPVAPPAQRTQVTKKDPVPLPALPKALVQSQLGTRIPISATTGYTFEEKFSMTHRPEAPPPAPDSDDSEPEATDERAKDAVVPPSQYLPAVEALPAPTAPPAPTPNGIDAAGAAPSGPEAAVPAASSAPATEAAAVSQSQPAPMELATEPDVTTEILIVVRLELPTPGGQRIQETILWNLNEKDTTPEDFAMAMCADMHLQEGCKRIIAMAIGAACERYAPLRLYRETREDLRLVRLQLSVGAVGLKDQFEWDINNTSNSPEAFARAMCVDLGLTREFEVSIAAAIRSQVLEYRLAAMQGRTFGRPPPMAYALRSEKELPMWTPALHLVKDVRRRGDGGPSGPAPGAAPQAGNVSLRPRSVASGQMQMLTPESFRGGTSSQSASSVKNVVYTLRT